MESEPLKKALTWLNEEHLIKPDVGLTALYETACIRFDLNPIECETLFKLIFGKPYNG